MRAYNLVEELSKKNIKLAIAESCTGGLISKLITDIPGSSRIFELGITAYANSIKQKILGVRNETLENYGAVSGQCAGEMAAGVRFLANADIAVAVTGIAGPGGGTSQKPVGTVYIAISTAQKTFARRYGFVGNRETIRKNTADKALEMLLEVLG